MRKKRIEKKKKIEPCGSITALKDIFKFKGKNLGVFKRPKIERKQCTVNNCNIICIGTYRHSLWEMG